MKFESVEAVQKYANNTNKVLVINNDEVLDVTTFAKHHPGTF
jgi:cytochrome b involved in lipid metabolism